MFNDKLNGTGMTTSHCDPNILGYMRTTMKITKIYENKYFN